MARKSQTTKPAPVEEKVATQIASISVDLGNAYSNLQADGGISDDWRSIQGIVSNASRMGDLPFDSAINFDGVWRVFGDPASTHATHIEDFPTTDRYISKFYRGLFAFALHRAYGKRFTESPFYPNVIASIPAREFAVDARVQQVKKNLIGAYLIQDVHGDCLQVDVMNDNLTIIPEGAGAYFATLKSDPLQQCTSGTWLVLDLGYLTADVVGFRDAEYMPDLASSNAELGIRYVANQVAKFVRGEGGPYLDPSWYDPRLGSDIILVNGREYNIANVRNTALMALADRLVRFSQKVATDQAVTGLILAGGGAERMQPFLRLDNMPCPIMAPNSRRANVEGAYGLLVE